LLFLSLPLAATLDFYAGFPLRVAAAEGAARLLELVGIDARRTGAMLLVHGREVGVDPACSGLRFLVHGGILAAALAALHRLSFARTALLGLAAVAAVIVANIFRATILVLPESGIVHFSGSAHEMIGLACFALTIPPLSILASRMATRNPIPRTHPPERIDHPSPFPVFLLSLAVLSLATASTPVPSASHAAPLDLPATFRFDGVVAPLHPLSLSETELHFAAGFPGAIARARWGQGELIVRRVDRATRRLHPSARCLRSAGFRTGTARTVTTDDGGSWSRYTAERDGRRWLVHERIVGSGPERATWTDVSQWFWSALRNPRSGPWRAETLILPEPKQPNASIM